MKNEQSCTIDAKEMQIMANCLIGLLEVGFKLPPVGAIFVMEQTVGHIKKFHGMSDIKTVFTPDEKHD